MQVPAVNEFSIGIATRNGSGSQTANQLLLRSILAMGVPAGGKNIFPSNISGMPTWYHIRVSEKGYLARSARTDLMVCLNPESLEEDLASLPPGAKALVDESDAGRVEGRGIEAIAVPFGVLAREVTSDAKLLKLVQNMVYVGVLVHLLGLELELVLDALQALFGAKSRAIEVNRKAIEAGFAWARATLSPDPRLRVERRDLTRGKILMEGNDATALGALFAGVGVVAWYPITPSTGVVEALSEYAERFRRDPLTGKMNIAVIQMEDELASAGVAVGAGWAGVRAMTATSGPGIDLMSEFVGLAYWTEQPAVFVDVQRTGPSTGLPTHTGQGDVELCAKASHGDTLHPCLYPADPRECFEFAYLAFDLAERFQTPVFFLSDLDLGMQTWLSEPLAFPEAPPDRGKVLDEAALASIVEWGRYRDPDGDGIPWRTLPGTPGGRGAWFARGSGRNAAALYSEKAEDYRGQLERLKRKFEGLRTRVPPSLLLPAPGSGPVAEGLIAFGSSDPAVREALDLLGALGRRLDYLRIRAFPFDAAVRDFLSSHGKVWVVEQNRDGQMANLLSSDFPEFAEKLHRVAYIDALPLTAAFVAEALGEGRTESPGSSRPGGRNHG